MIGPLIAIALMGQSQPGPAELQSPPPIAVPVEMSEALVDYLNCLQPAVARIANETKAVRSDEMRRVIVRAKSECSARRGADRLRAIELMKKNATISETQRPIIVGKAFDDLDAQLSQFADAIEARERATPPTPTASGGVTVRVEKDRQGRITACRIVTSSGNPDIDRQTCEVARRGGAGSAPRLPKTSDAKPGS